MKRYCITLPVRVFFISSLLLALVLGLVLASPAGAVSFNPTVALDSLPSDVYRGAAFDAVSSAHNPAEGSTVNARFNLTVSGPVDFAGARADTFTITHVNGSTDTQGVNDTFHLIDGDWVGYWGPADGFAMPTGYSATTTFTIQMNDSITAAQGTYAITIDLVSMPGQVGVDSASGSFNLSADTLHVGVGQQFETINSAVTASTAGDTIVVGAGTYDYISEGSPAPAGLIKISKPVTIKAADGVRPVIDGTGFDGVFKIWASTFSTGQVIVEGFDITGDSVTDIAITAAMKADEFGQSPRIIIRNNYIHGMNAGINFWGTGGGYVSNVQITDNTFYDLGENGVTQGFGIWLEGLAGRATLGDVYAAEIEENEFYNIYDGAGTDYGFAVGLQGGAANAYIANNSFTTVSIGTALIATDVADTCIELNDIGASLFGVMADTITNGPVDATGNWWGDASGPGTAVSVGVDYSPWLGAAPGTTPMTWYTNDSIQDAINAASSGATINVAAGTFNENVVVDVANLTILGTNYDIDPTDTESERGAESIINGGGTGSVVRVTADGVTISGFTVQNSAEMNTGTGEPGAGIVLGTFVDGTSSCIVENNIISGNDNGVLLLWGSDNYVEYNVVQDNTNWGIALAAADENEINFNYLTNNTADTIALANAGDIGGSATDGATNNSFNNNVIDGGGKGGFYLGMNCDGNSILGNHISGINSTTDAIAIFLHFSDDNHIEGNTITGNSTGIKVRSSSENAIGLNTVTQNAVVGIEVSCAPQSVTSQNNDIAFNTISGNAIGLNANDNDGNDVEQAPIQDAPRNYWGDASGPSGEGPGTGDAVSANVLYDPWYESTDMDSLVRGSSIYNTTKDIGYSTIQAAIDGASSGDIITLGAGTYEVDTTITVDESVTITGPATGDPAVVIGQSGDLVPVFAITANNVTIQNLEVTLTQNALDTYVAGENVYYGLIHVTSDGVTGTQILDNEIWLPSQGARDSMSTWSFFGIKFERSCTATITGNTIYNTRQGISGKYGSSLNIQDNTIYNTKGGVCIYTNLADIDNHNIGNNTWDAPTDASLSHSEWDIVWHTGGGDFTLVADWDAHYQAYVLTLSGANNGAYVTDWRHAGDNKATENNRSHVFVDIAGQESAEGGVTTPMNSINAAVTGVIPGGQVIVAAGTYEENVSTIKSFELIGAGSANTMISPASGTVVTLRGWSLPQPAHGSIDGFRIEGFTLVPPAGGMAFLAGSGTPDDTYYNTNLEIEDIVVDGSAGGMGIGLNAVQGVNLTNVHLQDVSGTAGALELTGVEDLLFTDGSISDSDIGVRLQPTGDGDIGDGYGPNGSIRINESTFTGNTVAIENQDTGFTLDASKNWWGTDSGADIYNMVSENVLFDPYYSSPAMDTLVSGAPVYNEDQDIGYYSIQAAIDGAEAGDTITVAADTYNESIVIDESITLLAPEGAANTKILGTGSIVVEILSDLDVTIDGFDIDVADSYGVYVNEIGAGFTVTIQNCDINNNWYGISADYVSGTLNILNNTIRDNSEWGVDIGVVWDGSVNAIGNVISGNRGGIYVNQIGGSVSIWNNTITQNDEGVYVNKVWEGAELDIIDNIISENWYDDEGDTSGDGIYIDNIVGTPETVNILRNEIRDNGEDGIEIREIYSSTVNIRDNEITGNPWGIYIEYVNGSSLNVTDNFITGPEDVEEIPDSIGVWIEHISDAPFTVNIERNTISGYPNGLRTFTIYQSTVNVRDNVIILPDGEALLQGGIMVGAAAESFLEITGNSINTQAVESVPATGIQIGMLGTPLEMGLSNYSTVINGNTVTGPFSDSYEGETPGSGIQITDIYEGETRIQDNNLAGNFCGLLFGSVELDSSTSVYYAEELYISGNQLARNLIGIMFNTDIESSALTITENNVSENLAGIIFGGEIVGGTEEYLELYRNTISGNYEAGLINSTGTSITAENNFWGTANGGEIAALIEGSVDYDPWHLKEGPQVDPFTGITTTSVVLNWTDPGDIWSDDYYDFRYSTSPIDTPAAWAAATRITGEPRPLDSTKSMVIRGLQEDTTYYFALALGYKNVSSELVTANITTEATDGPDETPPAAVADLAANAGSPSTTRINLAWTAPADDEGYVARYIIKRSSAEITADNWDAATTVFNSLTPKAPGQTENFTVTNLQPNTQYWFAVKSIDNAGNTSAISNIVNRATAAELPTVTGITEDPAGNHNGAARNVTITGANYAAGNTVVRLVKGADVVTLTNIVVVNATTITARVPAGVPVGVYQARVINSNGTSAPGGSYTVTAAPIPVPVVTNVSPNLATSGTAANNVKITGENFTGATAVTIGGMSAAITGNTGTRLTVNVPGLPAGEYDVLVTANGKSNGVSAVKYIVTAPVVVDENTTEDTTTSDVVTTSGTIPVQVTLTTDNSETATQNTDTNAEINVVIPPNTTVKDTSGNDYQGEINPPRVVKPDEETHGDVPDDAIVLEMGNPDETITFTQDLTVTVRVEAETLPQIYYLNKTTGKYELAGKAGTVDGVNYVAGGVQLAAEPINGKTLFTIGLLLDHMSTYVASNTDLRPQAPTPPVDDTPWYPAPQDDDDEPVLPEGSTDVRGFVNNEGRFTAAVNIASDDNSLVIDIPAGTIGLTADLEPLDAISMVVATDVPAAPQGSSIIGLPWDLGPDGAVFDPAISITMPYDPAVLPDNVAEEDLVVAWYDEANGQWVMLATTVDTVNKTVTASVSHFSVYALMGEVTEVVPDEPVVEPTQPTQTTEPAPDKPTTTPTAPTQTTSAPGQEDEPAASTFAWYWWLVIGIGAVIVIALIVVMIRNRRD